MPGSGVNPISQNQLQRRGYPLIIISEGIEIGNEMILARLVNNNLYVPELANSVFFSTALTAINKDTLQF